MVKYPAQVGAVDEHHSYTVTNMLATDLRSSADFGGVPGSRSHVLPHTGLASRNDLERSWPRSGPAPRSQASVNVFG